jgi:hypothetical protein
VSRIKQIVFYLAVAIVINWLAVMLQSVEFAKYLRENILVLLITLLAINTATISVVVAKLHEISIIENFPFERTIKEVKISLIEQVVLIAISGLLLILYNSPIIRGKLTYHDSIFNTLFIAIFVYAIDILRDTGIAVFEIIKHRKNEKGQT